MAALLDVRQLTVEFPRPSNNGGPAASAALTAVRGLSFSIATGEVLGLVGESGSGKSVTSLALMRLLPLHARTGGEIRFADGDEARDLLQLPDAAMRPLRGSSSSSVRFPKSLISWRCGCRLLHCRG